MKRGHPTIKRRPAAKSIRTRLDPAVIGPLLREAGFLATEADPIEVSALFDLSGRPKTVSARYEGGWSACLRLRKDGSYSLSQSIRLVTRGPK